MELTLVKKTSLGWLKCIQNSHDRRNLPKNKLIFPPYQIDLNDSIAKAERQNYIPEEDILAVLTVLT